MTGLHAEVVRDLPGLLRLRREWSALCESAAAGGLFLTPEWLVPWWLSFGGGRTLQLLCLRERPGGALVGLLPLFSERVALGGVEVRRLAFLGDGETGCDYLDLLAAPGREGEVFAAALRALGALEWELCDLDGLWREAATASALAMRFPEGRAVRAADTELGPGAEVVRDGALRFVCPYVSTVGHTWGEYLAGHPRRENLRRREKWLLKQPGAAIDVARGGDDSPRALERFFALHAARWESDGGSSGVSGDAGHAFHRLAVAELAARGWLRLYTLSVARRPVASVYGVVHRGKMIYYQSGYDPAWAPRSVGLVLLARVAEDTFREGLAELDFLRGDEAYKSDWARAERWTVRLRFWRGARGRAARAALAGTQLARGTIKRALPARTLEGLRKARNAWTAGRPHTAALRLIAGGARGHGDPDARSSR